MTAADIYRDNKANKDDAFSALFKSSQQEEDFSRFLGSYAVQKIRELGTKRSKRKAAATDRSVREHKEAGISFDDLDRPAKNTPTTPQNRQSGATPPCIPNSDRKPMNHSKKQQRAHKATLTLARSPSSPPPNAQD